jgi:uncharacterized protein (DUF1501 family)
MPLTRRQFLIRSFGAMGAAALAFERFGLANAFAQAADYKALVCIFLFGGNDANNILIPYDDYATYAAVRSTAATLAIPQTSLLQINPPSLGGKFGLHPSLIGLQQLFNDQNAAIVCNVGPLVEPTDRSAYLNGTAHVPINLFSHADQQGEWQTAVPNAFISTGWGGRTADKLAAPYASSTGFPIQVTMAGTTIFNTGVQESALGLSPAPTPMNGSLRLDSFPNPPEGDPRYTAMLNLLQVDDGFTLVRAASKITGQGIQVTTLLGSVGDPAVPPFPLSPRTSLGNQLEQAAKLISLRDVLGIKRQIIFCSLGGFDTHNGQVSTTDPTTGAQAGLLAQIGSAIKIFYDATVTMGVANQVVTFTLSDFSRTFVPNGNVGSDHAWGSHHFVVGGSVRGGDCYGMSGPNGTVFPTLAAAGPDDTDSGGNARGRWIPTTAVDQYAATLASWFGVSSADLPAVFPNIGKFGTANLGFLS